jgi:GT2 family glycosyltransferase
VIVSYNASADLDNCLRSLHDAPPRTSHEIVVVDNASQDDSAGMVRRRWPGVRVIELARNIGFAAANNVGIRQTSGELILLLNSDTLVPAGAIDRLIHAFHELPGASIAGPRLVNGTGKPELSFGRMIGPLAELRQKTIVGLAGHSRIEAMTSRPKVVDWVSGACLLVRRADAEAVGLLDERYFMYCEDVDFCAAIRGRGGRVYFTPAAEIVHLRGRSGKSDPRATEDAYRNSQLAFYRKHHPRWTPLLKAYLGLRGKLRG